MSDTAGKQHVFVNADLRVALTCAECEEVFTEPHTLPCCHVFCESCLESLPPREGQEGKVGGGGGGTHCKQCPLCEQFYPDMAYEKHELLTRLAESLKRLEGNTLPCYHCREARAAWYCTDCACNICVKCATKHSALNTTHRFNIIPYADDLCELSARSQTAYCHVHTEEKTRDYCRTCEVPVCYVCKYTSHQALNHDLETTDVASSRINEQFRAGINRLATSVVNHETHAKNAELRLRELDERGRVLLQLLAGKKDTLIARTEAQYQSECQQLYSLISAGTEQLSQYKEVHDRQAKSKRSLLVTTKVCLDHLAGRTPVNSLITRLKAHVGELMQDNEPIIEEKRLSLPQLMPNRRSETDTHLLGRIHNDLDNSQGQRSRLSRVKEWTARSSAYIIGSSTYFRGSCQSLSHSKDIWSMCYMALIVLLLSLVYYYVH